MKKIIILPEDHRRSRRDLAVEIARSIELRSKKAKITKLFFENVAPIGVEHLTKYYGYPLESTIDENLMAWTIACAAIEKIVTFNGIHWSLKNPNNPIAKKFAEQIITEYSNALNEISVVAQQSVNWDPSDVVYQDVIHTLNNLRVLGFRTEQIPRFLELVSQDSSRGLSVRIRPFAEQALGHPTAEVINATLKKVIDESKILSIESGSFLFSIEDFEDTYSKNSIPDLQETTNRLYNKLRACCELYLSNIIRLSEFDVGILVIGYGHLQKMLELFGQDNYEIKVMHTNLS